MLSTLGQTKGAEDLELCADQVSTLRSIADATNEASKIQAHFLQGLSATVINLIDEDDFEDMLAEFEELESWQAELRRMGAELDEQAAQIELPEAPRVRAGPAIP